MRELGSEAMESKELAGMLAGGIARCTRSMHCIVSWNDSITAVSMRFNLKAVKKTAHLPYESNTNCIILGQ